MSDSQRDTAFLRQCLRYDDSNERHQLEARITQAHGDERCVRRAVWLMALLTGLSMAGLCYAAVFLTDHPQNVSQFITPFVVKVLCALGLGSLICMLVFMGLAMVYRKELDQSREACRRLAVKLLESRLGKPSVMPLTGMVKEQDLLVNHSQAAVSASEIVKSPKELKD
jgi:hypothetical protein